jgi:hypothetical protein
VVKKKLSVLNVIVGGYGKTVSDIPNSEKCSGICAETVVIGFHHARNTLQPANSLLFVLGLFSRLRVLCFASSGLRFLVSANTDSIGGYRRYYILHLLTCSR